MMKLTQIIGLIYQEANRNKDASIDSQATYEASDNKMAASDVNAKSSPFPSPVSLQDQSSMARIRAILEDDHSTDLETLLERYSTESADRGLRTKMLQALLPYIHQCVQTLTHENVSADRKKNIFNIVHAIQINYESGRLYVPVDQRLELANALADIFISRTDFNTAIAELRLRWVDQEVIGRQVLKELSGFTPNALDLSAISFDRAIETQALTHTRSAKIVDIDGKKYRVKNIKYGNVRAVEEVLMTKFYALSGLDCPNVKLAMNGQKLFDFCAESRRDYHDHANQPENFAVVASELVPAFQDLGRMVLEEDMMRPMIREHAGANSVEKYDEALRVYKIEQQKEQKLIELQSKQVLGSEKHNADITIKMRCARAVQLNARLKMVTLLPEHYKQSMMTAYCVSRLVADWDFENFDLYNFGFNGERSMLVDFGNCGTMGFGGMQKTDSLKRANSRARESDPQAPNAMRKEDMQFNGTVAPSLTGIGSLPRARPIAPLVQSITKIENSIANAGHGLRDLAKHDLAPLSPVFEAIFRLSLIPDEAFHRLAKENWPGGAGLFPYYEEDKLRLSADAFANVMIDRRNALTAQFKQSEIHDWEERNKQTVKNAHCEVAAAVASLTGIFIKPYFGEDTLTSNLTGRRMSRSALV